MRVYLDNCCYILKKARALTSMRVANPVEFIGGD